MQVPIDAHSLHSQSSNVSSEFKQQSSRFAHPHFRDAHFF